MTKIEELKSRLIQQAKDESKIDYDSVENTLDEIIERVGLFMFDLGYEKGWNDCTEDYDLDEPDDSELFDEDVEDVAELLEKETIKGKKL